MAIELKKNISEKEIDLVSLLFLLIKHKRVILWFSSILTLLSILYCLIATPIYEAKALVQIEHKKGSTFLDDINNALSASKPLSATEIEIIRSRMILGKTIHDLNLDTEIEESFFPFIGKKLANLLRSGDNQITVSHFMVPKSWYDEKFQLKIIDENNYVLSKDKKQLISGKVGQFESANQIFLFVDEINAKKGTEFAISKLPELTAIDKLSKTLSIEDKGKDTGILQFRLEGPNPVLVKKIVDQIAHNYITQNVERNAEEAARSLNFLKNQLPQIKAELDKSETVLNQFRQAHDSINLSLEAKSILHVSVSLETQLNELTFKESEISKLYTKEHPAYRALLEKRQTLLTEKNKLACKINALPPTQQQILSLTRDVKANNEIYVTLLNKQQELGILKAAAIGNVRIIDSAMTELDPIKPKKTMIVFASLLAGFFLSSIYLMLRNALRRVIECVEQLEELGINVYASVPLSDWQIKQDTQFKRSLIKIKQEKNMRSNRLVSIDCPADLSVESLRSLRTSLHFAMMQAKNKVLAISGCTPEIGKTFVTTNLSVVIADANQKVLLIDADMRKGYLHELMETKMPYGGLSEYLSGQIDFGKIIYKSPQRALLDFIPRGRIPPNPSELLMNARITELLEWAHYNYDLVLIDTPPILAVTDACIINRYAGTVMMVVRYGKNSLKEVEFSVQRLKQNNIAINGVIFNGVVKNDDIYRYGYSYK